MKGRLSALEVLENLDIEIAKAVLEQEVLEHQANEIERQVDYRGRPKKILNKTENDFQCMTASTVFKVKEKASHDWYFLQSLQKNNTRKLLLKSLDQNEAIPKLDLILVRLLALKRRK